MTDNVTHNNFNNLGEEAIDQEMQLAELIARSRIEASIETFTKEMKRKCESELKSILHEFHAFKHKFQKTIEYKNLLEEKNSIIKNFNYFIKQTENYKEELVALVLKPFNTLTEEERLRLENVENVFKSLECNNSVNYHSFFNKDFDVQSKHLILNDTININSFVNENFVNYHLFSQFKQEALTGEMDYIITKHSLNSGKILSFDQFGKLSSTTFNIQTEDDIVLNDIKVEFNKEMQNMIEKKYNKNLQTFFTSTNCGEIYWDKPAVSLNNLSYLKSFAEEDKYEDVHNILPILGDRIDNRNPSIKRTAFDASL